MEPTAVERYFDENSRAWISDGYEGDDLRYPTALARLKAVIDLLTRRFPGGGKEIVDLGCGGGHLSLRLAQEGFRVAGVDASEPMLAEAARALAGSPPALRDRVRFLKGKVLDSGLPAGSADVVTAMGLIGYLPDDACFFREAARLLRPGGLLLVSCRNRLFNMLSLSEYTVREIQQGTAQDLVEQIQRLLQPVPQEEAARFLSELAGASAALKQGGQDPGSAPPRGEKTAQEPAFTSSIEARQQTPEEITAVARDHGFQTEGIRGIHPHLMVPHLNRLLPAGLFNRLSSSLEPLAHLPVSLLWSSVFLGIFRKS